MSQKLLAGKIALITGASNGLGAAIAKRYISEGAHVIIVGRNLSKLEAIDDYAQEHGSQTTIVQLDLMDFPKIAELGQKIAEKFGHIDILVGNAAILGELSPLDHFHYKVWDKVIATNLTANWHLIRVMNPLLQKSLNGRALFVTCDVTQTVSPYWGAYSVSKAGLENLVKIYAAENLKTKLRVNLINPGNMGTKLRKDAMPGLDEDAWLKPDEATEIFVKAVLDNNIVSGEILYK
jgi:NAD(P)-dependent dehydrogenase (short-subunit alcohol dehydrogenase family)